MRLARFDRLSYEPLFQSDPFFSAKRINIVLAFGLLVEFEKRKLKVEQTRASARLV